MLNNKDQNKSIELSCKKRKKELELKCESYQKWQFTYVFYEQQRVKWCYLNI